MSSTEENHIFVIWIFLWFLLYASSKCLQSSIISSFESFTPIMILHSFLIQVFVFHDSISNNDHESQLSLFGFIFSGYFFKEFDTKSDSNSLSM